MSREKPNSTRAVLMICLATTACGSELGPAVAPTGITLQHLTESGPLPPSALEELVILSESRVCVLASYDVRIVCGGPEWRSTTYLGREGRGPEEILMPGPLLRMPDGGLAYFDRRNNRLTFFTPDLAFSGHLRLPSLGSPIGQITRDSLLFIADNGLALDPTSKGRPQLIRRQRRLLTLDLAAATVIDSTPLSFDPAALALGNMMASPIQRDSTRLLLRGTGDYLLWMTSDAQKATGFIPPPAFDPGLPDSLDMEDRRADFHVILGVVLESDVEQARRRPRHHYPRQDIAAFDASGRLWVLTNRRQEPGTTYIDLYDHTEFLGSLPVPGRVVAFRILDSLLVTMNRDLEEGTNGIRERRLNWYRIKNKGTTSAAADRN